MAYYHTTLWPIMRLLKWPLDIHIQQYLSQCDCPYRNNDIFVILYLNADPTQFDAHGLPPPGDYPLTFDELRHSMLVVGPGGVDSTWDTTWRETLVAPWKR